MYILKDTIFFRDSNSVEKGTELIKLEKDSDGMIKVETADKNEIKRIFWIKEEFLEKIDK